MQVDIFIIGGGPAGYEAALECARGGLSVVLAEKAELGGTCLNRGCIPSKLLLGATEVVSELAAQSRQRLVKGQVSVDLAAAQKKKARTIGGTRKSMAAQLAELGVTVLEGQASFAGLQSAVVQTADGEIRVEFGHAVLACGSTPVFPGGLTPDGETVLASHHALDLAEAPESLIVVGGGYIGLEMGQIFLRLGSTVHVVEGLDRIAATEDPEVSRELQNILARKGMKFHTGAMVQNLEVVDGRVRLTLDGGQTLEAEKALVAIGRGPATTGLNLDAAGVKTTERGWVETDDELRAAPAVSAVGDVNGRLMLAHAAERQARYVASRLLAQKAGASCTPYHAGVTPSCIYGEPEVLRAGPTPAELAAQGLPAEVSTAPLAANPMAQAHSATQGFVKVAWVDGKVASISAVGHGVGTMGTLAGIIVAQGWTAGDIHEVIFPHPSLDEALKAALSAPRQKLESES